VNPSSTEGFFAFMPELANLAFYILSRHERRRREKHQGMGG
jgi:hypothetical protein